MPNPANPVLVTLSRGDLVESVHRGALAIMDASGRLHAALGAIDATIYPRSAFKMLQALPLVESGAADAFGVSAADLALACASHAGEAVHTEAVMAWLARIGACEADLACGPHAPHHAATAEALLCSGQAPGRRHNNCSGKHTGFLTLARHLGAPLGGYTGLEHPVQRQVRSAIAEMAGLAPEALTPGPDGCAAPNFAMPLAALARAMARLADPQALSPPRAAAARRLVAAVAAHPVHVSGTGRADAVLIAAAQGRAVVKTGAEGVYCGVLPGRGLGVALKIDDGATRASETAMAQLLVALGAVPAEAAGVADLRTAVLRDTRGQPVGVRQASPVLAGLAL